MLLIILVFVVVFGAVTFVVVLSTAGEAASSKANTALETALKLPDYSFQDDAVDIGKSVQLSSMPWLNAILLRIRSVTELTRLLQQADIGWTPGRLVLSSIAAWAIAGYLIDLRTGLGWLALVLSLPVGAAPWIFVLVKKRMRFNKFEAAMPDALDMVVSALRGGHSMLSALGMAANEAPDPVGREFRLCFEEQNFGVDLRTALNNLVRRIPLQDLRMVATCIIIQKESGGNLAEVLDKTAHVIRERFRIREEVKTHTAQGRLTGWILALLPVGLGILIFIISPEHIMLLFTNPLGQKMIGTGVVMNLVGLLIIRRIVNVRV
jgi:tight adherence protein B